MGKCIVVVRLGLKLFSEAGQSTSGDIGTPEACAGPRRRADVGRKAGIQAPGRRASQKPMPTRPPRPMPIEMRAARRQRAARGRAAGRGTLAVAARGGRRDFFVLLAAATHLPSTSDVPRPHSSGQTRSLRLVTASSASVVGSWLGIDILAWRPKLASASRPLSPHCPSTSPASQPTRFSSVCSERARVRGSGRLELGQRRHPRRLLLGRHASSAAPPSPWRGPRTCRSDSARGRPR